MSNQPDELDQIAEEVASVLEQDPGHWADQPGRTQVMATVTNDHGAPPEPDRPIDPITITIEVERSVAAQFVARERGVMDLAAIADGRVGPLELRRWVGSAIIRAAYADLERNDPTTQWVQALDTIPDTKETTP